jgi:hypothetical protein
MEHPAGDQELVATESSRAEERAEHAGSAKQHDTDQRSEVLVPNVDAPNAASSGTMGVVLGAGTSNDNPATEENAPEAAAIKEEPEIEEINQAPKETVQPQHIHMARKRHGKWVFHEEDHSNKAMCRL